MKKLMIVAAAAAMTFAAQAGFSVKPCENCGASGKSDCDVAVFKVTGSGKAVIPSGDYKTVGNLKITKGALALVGTLCADTGLCCYSDGEFYATIKAGKKSFKLAADVTAEVWSLFGKNLEKTRYFDESIKPGKKVSLDSALFVTSADSVTYSTAEEADLDSALSFWASAFGKVDFRVTKAGSGYCKNPQGCDPEYTPKSYSGWFVGTYPCVGDEDCFLCDCTDTDIFGGTWKATYQAKAKTVAAAQKLAGGKFVDDDDED